MSTTDNANANANEYVKTYKTIALDHETIMDILTSHPALQAAPTFEDRCPDGGNTGNHCRCYNGTDLEGDVNEPCCYCGKSKMDYYIALASKRLEYVDAQLAAIFSPNSIANSGISTNLSMRPQLTDLKEILMAFSSILRMIKDESVPVKDVHRAVRAFGGLMLEQCAKTLKRAMEVKNINLGDISTAAVLTTKIGEQLTKEGTDAGSNTLHNRMADMARRIADQVELDLTHAMFNTARNQPEKPEKVTDPVTSDVGGKVGTNERASETQAYTEQEKYNTPLERWPARSRVTKLVLSSSVPKIVEPFYSIEDLHRLPLPTHHKPHGYTAPRGSRESYTKRITEYFGGVELIPRGNPSFGEGIKRGIRNGTLDPYYLMGLNHPSNRREWEFVDHSDLAIWRNKRDNKYYFLNINLQFVDCPRGCTSFDEALSLLKSYLSVYNRYVVSPPWDPQFFEWLEVLPIKLRLDPETGRRNALGVLYCIQTGAFHATMVQPIGNGDFDLSSPGTSSIGQSSMEAALTLGHRIWGISRIHEN